MHKHANCGQAVQRSYWPDNFYLFKFYFYYILKVKEIISTMDKATGKDLVYRWSVTQAQTIEEQLQSGIRYLDIRISYSHSQHEM